MRSTITVSITALLILLLPGIFNGLGSQGTFHGEPTAIEASASRLPPVMKAAADDLVYNAYEPDRWREEATSAMNLAQAPDHFFDSEYWGTISTIPNDRYAFMTAFMTKANARNVDLIKVGYLPYSIIENYGRLPKCIPELEECETDGDRESARANAVHYAGILGHYVADGTMPMPLIRAFQRLG